MQMVCSEVRFCEKSRGKCSFWKLGCHFSWKSRGKCSFWKLGLSLLVKVSFRGKCLFWKLGVPLLVKVSRKMLVLEAGIVTFCEGLAENARFWKLGFSLFVRVS